MRNKPMCLEDIQRDIYIIKKELVQRHLVTYGVEEAKKKQSNQELQKISKRQRGKS